MAPDAPPRPALRPATFKALAGLLILGGIVCAVAAIGEIRRDQTRVDPGYRLNVNTATIGQLQVLPRVGPTTAEHIVAYRAEHGPFQRIEDLDEVRLIGPVTLDRLAPWVRFD